MNNQVPWNFSAASGDSEKGQSSGNENSFDFLESCVSQLPTSWHQTSHSLDTDMDDFSDVFGNLVDVELSAAPSAQFSSSLVSKLETISCEHGKGQSSGTVKKPDKIVLRKCPCDATEISEGIQRKPDNRPKRTRSAELHNQSERSDRTSVLDDAVNYVKALRHQVEMMSAQGGAIFQAPFMSPRGYQSTQVPHFSPCVPISPKLGMGIGFGTGTVNMCCSAGHPMILSAPSASLHPSSGAGVGLPLMSASRNLAVSQMQMPCIQSSQQLSPSVDTSAMPPNFVLGGYSPAFHFSNEVESSSKRCQELPLIINRDFANKP